MRDLLLDDLIWSRGPIEGPFAFVRRASRRRLLFVHVTIVLASLLAGYKRDGDLQAR